MSNELETLAKKQDAILLAEIGAWLHMLGKYNWDFIRYHCGEKSGYDYQSFFLDTTTKKLNKAFQTDYPELALLFDPDSIMLKPFWSSLPLSVPNNFRSFLQEHREIKKARQNDASLSELTMLLIEGHGRSSGIEKGIAAGALKSQLLPDVNITTAFGFNKKLTSLDYRTNLLHELDEFFQSLLPNLGKKGMVNIFWKKHMQKFKHLLKEYFPNVLAETRKPTNDISLQDQTAAAVAFFKTALAERIIEAKWKPLLNFELTTHTLTKLESNLSADILKELNNLKNIKYKTEEEFITALEQEIGKREINTYKSKILEWVGQKPQYCWRIFSISVNIPDYLSRSLTLPDLLSRKERIEKAQELTRILLEVQYPLGDEIYRDQSTIAFLIPGEGEILEWKNKKDISLQDKITRIYTRRTNGEIAIQLEKAFIKEGSRSIYKFGETLNRPLPHNTPDQESTRKNWKNSSEENVRAQICTNCQLRPQGRSDKAKSRNICDTCLHKRTARSKTWCNHLESTVWLDEVADNNGRVALLVGQFELKDWLNGLLWNSVRAVLNQSQTNLLSYPELYKHIQESLKRDEFYGLLTQLIDKNARDQYNSKFKPYFDEVIWEDWKDIIAKTTEETEASVAAVHILRQQPSFARIQRVWKTTKDFFASVYQRIASETPIPYRIYLRGAIMLEPQQKLSKYHTYDTILNDVETSFVCVAYDPVAQQGQFISTDNREYFAKQLRDEKALKLSEERLEKHYQKQIFKHGDTLKFYEERGSRGTPSHVATLTIEACELKEHNYTATVPILTEPRLFMVLIPADRAMAVAKYIQWKYETEFSKVRDRLPLHLSLIYFHRRTPLRAAMDAAQRMLKRTSSAELWMVQSTQACSGQYLTQLRLLRERDHKELNVLVNHGFGDGIAHIHSKPLYRRPTSSKHWCMSAN